MVEVPTTIGASGIKLSSISPQEDSQFMKVISSLEEYSQSLVANFEGTTKKIRDRLNDGGSTALQALIKLAESKDTMEKMAKESFDELQNIIADVEAIVKEFDGLDGIQNEILLLSDLLTTVEEAVKRPQ